jgi:hypothetical protein
LLPSPLPKLRLRASVFDAKKLYEDHVFGDPKVGKAPDFIFLEVLGPLGEVEMAVAFGPARAFSTG